MFSNDDRFGRDARVDAIDGFDAIAAALDQGVELDACAGTRLSDVLAIGLGWGLLAAAIFYPGLQLLAIVVGIAFFSMRSFARLVLGSPRRERELTVFVPVSSNFMRAA